MSPARSSTATTILGVATSPEPVGHIAEEPMPHLAAACGPKDGLLPFDKSDRKPPFRSLFKPMPSRLGDETPMISGFRVSRPWRARRRGGFFDPYQ
jgi:hypothetical protein